MNHGENNRKVLKCADSCISKANRH